MPRPSTILYFFSAFGYTVRPIIILLLIKILFRKRKRNLTLWVLVFVGGIVAFSSQFTHLMFWFDENNGFHRGILGFFPHAICGVFMVVTAIVTFKLYMVINKSEILTLIYILIIALIGTLLESIWNLRVVLPGSMAISYAIYYIYLYMQIYKRDELTGLLNRRSLYLDAENWLRAVSQLFQLI